MLMKEILSLKFKMEFARKKNQFEVSAENVSSRLSYATYRVAPSYLHQVTSVAGEGSMYILESL